MNAVEKRMDSYLRRVYDISLYERNLILEEQGHKCACCGRAFDGTCRMEVDHQHVKVIVSRYEPNGWYGMIQGNPKEQGGKGWVASYEHNVVWYFRKTKLKAIKAAKLASRRESIRGILCGGRYAGCNRKLGRIDTIPFIENTLAYLKNPPAQRVLDRFRHVEERGPHATKDSDSGSARRTNGFARTSD